MTWAPPYVGLAPFGEADAGRFFGRDAERKRIIANLQASRFTLLYARSGVGKSSLLRAGVVARIAAAPESRLVPIIFSSWSGNPLLELPRALGAGGDDLEQALERRAREADGTLLVILDQFEEFFEYHQHTPAGERFADDLARCVRRADLRAHFLVSIREDAYSRLGDEFKGRLPNVYANYLHLDDLDERGARAAIEEPLRHDGDAAIEPALVDQVLRDVRRDEGSNGHARYETAHLQYVLRRLWDEEAKRGSQVLRLATLEGLGGSQAIFERHFEEAVAGLGAAEQDALAKAFRFLISSSGTKRAESPADLAELADVPRPILERTLEHLRDARILEPVAAGGQTRYELAHDLLAAPALEWRRQRERAHELRGLRRIIAALAVVAAVLGALIVWALLERAAAARQADHARAQALVAESANQLSVDPEHSLELARRAWQGSPSPEAEKALRRALAASLVRRRLVVGETWRGTVSQDGGVIVTEGPAGVLAWRGLVSRSPATRLRGDGRPVISADGSVVAAVGQDGVEVARTDGSGTPVRILGADYPAVSKDGSYAAAVDDRGLRIVEASTGRTLAQRPISFEAEPVLSFDPSDAGRLVAGECQGGSLTVWNWRDGGASTLPGAAGNSVRIPRGGDAACLLVVSPDGTRAAQSDAGGGAKLWDLAHDRRVAFDSPSRLAVSDLSWSEGGDRLAIAAGNVATVVDRDGRELTRTPSQVAFITSVAFNRPRGDLIVTSSRDGVARVWDVPSAGMLAELRGHTDEVADAAFTAGGREVVTLSLDGSARVWRVVEGRVIRGTDWMLDAAFAPDGKRIATAAADGSVRVAPLAGGPAIEIVNAAFPLQTAKSVTFDRTGRRVAVAGGHDAQLGEILVANAESGKLEKVIYPPGKPVSSAAFSRDGEWLVTTAIDTPVALWRLSDFGLGDRSDPTATLDLPRGRSALWAEFSPVERTIVTAANDGVARIHDLRPGGKTRELKSPGLAYGARFSPDGRRILTYGSDFIGRIWDARTGRQLARLSGHSSWISRGAFSSPDGRLVVTGSADQTTRVWAARDGRLLSTQREHGGIVNSVAFSPDSKTILSGGDDETVRLYPCATCAPVKELVELARDRVLSGGG